MLACIGVLRCGPFNFLDEPIMSGPHYPGFDTLSLHAGATPDPDPDLQSRSQKEQLP